MSAHSQLTAPEQERRRLSEVAQYDALSGEPLPDLEAIARIAARICGVRNATVNLFDAEHQHQVATEGFVGAVTSRVESMCNAILDDQAPVHVSDVRVDPRWRDNPWVTGERGNVVFYASSQLRGRSGTALGTLCVFDEAVHDLDAEQRRALDDLAAQAVALLELRREARALRRTNAELEAFAGQIAHDLRSPLAAVQGFLQLAVGRFGAELGPRAESCVASALSGSRRMADLLSDLLAFATAARAPERRPVKVHDLVRAVVADVEAERAGADATIELDVPADLEVSTDPSLLHPVLLNLLTNALRYRHPERPARVVVSARAETDRWELVVADNGIGVPLEERQRIFEVLTRGSNAVGTPGTGIGLATVARLVGGLGGRIDVSGEPGQGARFTLSLPAS